MRGHNEVYKKPKARRCVALRCTGSGKTSVFIKLIKSVMDMENSGHACA